MQIPQKFVQALFWDKARFPWRRARDAPWSPWKRRERQGAERLNLSKQAAQGLLMPMPVLSTLSASSFGPANLVLVAQSGGELPVLENVKRVQNAGLEGTLQNWPGASSVSENRSGFNPSNISKENN